MRENPPRQDADRASRPVETRERQVKAPAAEPKKPVPDGFVDPAAGIVFPQKIRKRR